MNSANRVSGIDSSLKPKRALGALALDRPQRLRALLNFSLDFNPRQLPPSRDLTAALEQTTGRAHSSARDNTATLLRNLHIQKDVEQEV